MLLLMGEKYQQNKSKPMVGENILKLGVQKGVKSKIYKEYIQSTEKLNK